MKKPLEKIDATRGLVGFKCPKSGRNEPFDFCWKTCANHCKPLPLLLSLAGGSRDSEENLYHVTEILNPPQIVYLSRNNPYYARPDSLVDMNLGTSWHEKIEKTRESVKALGLEEDYIMEQNFKEHVHVYLASDVNRPLSDISITLSGTPDLYVKSTKTLWDYKVMKYYWTFKYLSEGKWDDSTIPWQLNIYRVLAQPEAEQMKLLCYLKDWKLNFPDRYGVDRVETIQVPKIPDKVVVNRVNDLLMEHVETQKTGKFRPCTEAEMWNNGIRCKEYCPVSEICEQNDKNINTKK